MAGTPDVTSNFETKTELDFRNRLIAKFEIPRGTRFWNDGSAGTPKTALYPSNDRVYDICQEVIAQISDEEAASGDLGHLLVEWGKLEEELLPRARRLTGKNISTGEAIRALAERGLITKEIAGPLDQVRRVRNTAAHRPGQISQAEVQRALAELRQLAKLIQSDPSMASQTKKR